MGDDLMEILTKEKHIAESIQKFDVCRTIVWGKYDYMLEHGKTKEEIYEWLMKELRKCNKFLESCEPYYRLINIDNLPFVKKAKEWVDNHEG